MTHVALTGIFPAMITPYREDGSVDTAGLSRHAEFLLAAGVHGLHPCGTTGEAPLLSSAERKLVAETVIDTVAGRAPVIIQVGHLLTGEAAELAAHAVSAGADAISVVTPYYYGLPAGALRDYFSEVVSAVPAEFPVYLYNIPQCTTNPVSAELLASVMSEHPNVLGIKHSQNDLVWLAAFIEASGGKAEVFVGSDDVVLPGLVQGAVGVVSGNANVFPEAFVDLYRAVRAGELERARELQRAISQLARLLGNGGSLTSFKAAAAQRGVPISDAVRAPLPQLDAAAEERVRTALRTAAEWGLIG